MTIMCICKLLRKIGSKAKQITIPIKGCSQINLCVVAAHMIQLRIRDMPFKLVEWEG